MKLHGSIFSLSVSLPGRKPAKITIWRVFACRPFASPGKDTTNRGKNAKGRHAKTRQMMTFLFSHGNLSPRHTKVRDIPCVASLPGKAKGRHTKIRQNHLLACFRLATFCIFALKTHLYDMA